MEPWEDELLLDDDFSEEEEDAEEQIEKTSLEMDADGFADWEDSSDGAPEDETLEKCLLFVNGKSCLIRGVTYIWLTGHMV